MLIFPYGMSGGWDSAEKPARLPEFHLDRRDQKPFDGTESAERAAWPRVSLLFAWAWDLLLTPERGRASYRGAS